MEPSFAQSVLMLKKDFSEYCNRRMQALGLTQGLMFFLIYVGKHPGCAPGELADALRADAGHTARSVEKLAQLGLMTRSRNETDRRSFSLCLTPLGEDAFQQLRGYFAEWDSLILSRLTPEQKRELFSLLELTLTELDGDMKCKQ